MSFPWLYLEPAWLWVWKALNSSLASSLVVAFTGSLFGAYTAKRIAERAKLKDDLLKEIRNINAASIIAFGITNSHIAIKKQHVRGLYKRFHDKRQELIDIRNKNERGELKQKVVFNFQADFESLAPLAQPIGALQNLIFDKLTSTGKVALLAATLSQMMQSLNESIQHRNTLIENWKQRGLAQDELVALYFGLPQRDGRVIDQTYATLVEAIYEYTDDVIAFGKMLGAELAAEGDRIKGVFQKSFPRFESPSITKVDFAKATAEGLMPPPEKFTDFSEMFSPEAGSKKSNLWRRLTCKLLASSSR